MLKKYILIGLLIGIGSFSFAQVMLPPFQAVFNKSASGTTTVATIVIGTQELMVKNLEVVTYRNGDPIPQVTDASAWSLLTTGAWCYFNNDSTNGSKYGKLYNWYAVNDARGLAPQGWHISTDSEFTTLTSFLGGESVAGGKMKEVGTVNWASPNTGADNSSGFAGLPGGFRGSSGNFNFLGILGNWWSTPEIDVSNAYYRTLSNNLGSIARTVSNKRRGFSVRCFRD